MSLPPYEPSNNGLPPLPVEDCTAKQLIERYSISKQTFYTRLSAIGVTGIKRGKMVWFDQSDIYRLDASHFYLGKGYGLKDIRKACGGYEEEEVVDLQDSQISDPVVEKQTELVIAPSQEKVVMALTTAVRNALQASIPIPVRDPLQTYRLLDEATTKKYQLTSHSLRDILEVTQSTINSYDKEVLRCGFLLKRVGAGKWRVFRDEEVEAA